MKQTKRFAVSVACITILLAIMLGIVWAGNALLSAHYRLQGKIDQWILLEEEAIQQLRHYANMQSSSHYDRFRDQVRTLRVQKRASDRVMDASVPADTAKQALVEQGNVSLGDAGRMTWFIRQMRMFEPIRETMDRWVRVTRTLSMVDSSGTLIHKEIAKGPVDSAHILEFHRMIDQAEGEIQTRKARLDDHLGRSSTMLRDMIWRVSLIVAGILWIGTIAVIGFIGNRQRKTEEELEHMVKEREVLIQEIHHRVKNNFAVISGLLDLQLEGVEDEEMRNILNVAKSRIHSMGMIHEYHYQTEQFHDIPFDKYVSWVVDHAVSTFKPAHLELSIEVNAENVHLNINQAIPASMILTELLNNVMRHAFIGLEDGKLTVNLAKNEDTRTIRLSVVDDGIGLPEESLEDDQVRGMLIIKNLVQQLEGTIKYNARDGTRVTLQFPYEEVRGSASTLQYGMR